MKVLLVGSYYPEYLRELYAAEPGLADLPYDQQIARIFEGAFGAGDAYVAGLTAAGCEARQLIVNADPLQHRWAVEHGVESVENLHDRRRQIVAAQLREFRPDVLYVFEWCPLGDAFLTEMKPLVRLLAGQVASPLHRGRTYAAYDLMISSYPPLVEHFRGRGMASAPLRLAFDDRVLQKLESGPAAYDVTFVGGFAPSHVDRIAWLEGLLAELPVAVFGYGVEQLPAGSPIHRAHRGPAWGWKMYEVLSRSRVTLNRHARIDVDGRYEPRFANNMRLYEAAGVGTCLVTENRVNLGEILAPGREVATYTTVDECVAVIRDLLADETRRRQIAKAGQTRTLAEHTYKQRMTDLAELLSRAVADV